MMTNVKTMEPVNAEAIAVHSLDDAHKLIDLVNETIFKDTPHFLMKYKDETMRDTVLEKLHMHNRVHMIFMNYEYLEKWYWNMVQIMQDSKWMPLHNRLCSRSHDDELLYTIAHNGLASFNIVKDVKPNRYKASICLRQIDRTYASDFHDTIDEILTTIEGLTDMHIPAYYQYYNKDLHHLWD